MGLVLSAEAVQDITGGRGRASRRVRGLLLPVTAWYVIAMSLFLSAGYERILVWLAQQSAVAARPCGKKLTQPRLPASGEEPLASYVRPPGPPLNARFAALVGSGSHPAFGAAIGQYRASEIILAEGVMDKLLSAGGDSFKISAAEVGKPF